MEPLVSFWNLIELQLTGAVPRAAYDIIPGIKDPGYLYIGNQGAVANISHNNELRIMAG